MGLHYTDPISRMYTSLLVDGQTLGDVLTLDTVNEWKQIEMNTIFSNLESYSELCKAAKQSGMQIISVCLTNHILSSKLSSLFAREQDISRELNNELKSKAKRQKILSIENDSKIKEIENAAELRRIQIESDDRLEKEMHVMKVESLKRKSGLEANEINVSIKVAKMKNE